MFSAFSSGQGSSSGSSKQLEDALNYRSDEIVYEYAEKDVILYALGLGARRTDLDLVYENSENFFALPTFAVLPVFSVPIDYSEFLPEFNPMKLLHGEQYLELHGPIPTSNTLKVQGRIIEMIDKGKSAIVVMGVDIKDQDNKLLAEAQSTIFIRGAGGFGGPSKGKDRGAATAANNPPKGKTPDVVEYVTTGPDQAALYRLSGDYNPLHIDPNMSQIGGFEVPILHGLCTYGMAAKAALARFGGNEPNAIKSIKARFSSHVIPGDRIEIPMWIDPNNNRKVIFQVLVAGRSPPAYAISNAAIEFNHPVKLLPPRKQGSEFKL